MLCSPLQTLHSFALDTVAPALSAAGQSAQPPAASDVVCSIQLPGPAHSDTEVRPEL